MGGLLNRQIESHESQVGDDGAVRRIGAGEWLYERGLKRRGNEPLLLRGETMRIGAIALSRVAYPPADLTRVASDDSSVDDQLIIGAILDGSTTYYRGNERFQMGQNSAMLFRRSELWSVKNVVPIAGLSVIISGDLLHRYSLLPELNSGPYILKQDHVKALSAFSSFAFRFGQTIGGPESSYLRRGAENLIVGLIRDATGIRLRESSTAEHRLFRDALTMISRLSSSPDLTVTSLARHLNVSERHLQRAFASSGTSPLMSIRAARVERAVGYLSEDDDLSAGEILDIALRSGFRSTRAMNTAIRDHRGLRLG